MVARTELRRLGAAALVLVAVAAIAAGLTRVTVDTGIDSFVPRGDAAYADLQARDLDFGGDPIVVLLTGTSRNGLLLDAEQLVRLVALEGALSRLPDVAVVYGPGTVLNQTASSVRNVLLQMSGRRDALENTAQAQARSKGLVGARAEMYVARALAAFDTRYGALIAQAMPMGLPSLKNQKFVASVLLGNAGEPRPEWKFLVPTAKSATVLVRPREGLDQAGALRLTDRVEAAVRDAGLKTAKPTVTGVPVLTSAVSDRAAAEAPRVGLAALVGVGLVFLAIPWSKRRRDRLRPLLAAALGTGTTIALFGWFDRPLSLGVVAFLPIVLGIGSDFPLYLAQPAHRRRVLVAAGGAVLAFATLAISQLPFVREFGIALALGVVATVAWALVLRVRFREIEPAPVAARPRGGARRIALRPLAAAAVLAAVVGWAMLPGLRIESSPDQLAQGLPELADVGTAERALGFSGEISVVVRGKKVLSPEVLTWAEDVEAAIVTRHGDELRPLLTLGRLLEFLGPRATPEQVTAGSSLLPPYLLNAVVSGDGDVASSTFGVRLDDLEEQRTLIRDVQELIPAAPDGYQVEVVGLPVVATSGLSAMSASRYLIGLVGLAVAALAVGLGLHSRRLAAMVAAASALSSGWVYLGIRLSGGELTPLTLAVGALITVTACEFTVMLDGARSARDRWLNRSVAVAATAGTVGYLCLALSDLAVLRTFGLVLAAGVVSTYLASRLVVALAGQRPGRATAGTTSAAAAELGGAGPLNRTKELV